MINNSTNQSLRPERGSLAFQTPAAVKNSRRLILVPFAWPCSPLSSLHSASQLSRATNVVRSIHPGPAPRRSTSMLGIMKIIFGVLSTICLIISICVHASTFFGVDILEIWPSVWILHLGIFILCAPMIYWLRHLGRNNLIFLDEYRWKKNVFHVTFGYVFINFLIFAFVLCDGTPHRGVRDCLVFKKSTLSLSSRP